MKNVKQSPSSYHTYTFRMLYIRFMSINCSPFSIKKMTLLAQREGKKQALFNQISFTTIRMEAVAVSPVDTHFARIFDMTVGYIKIYRGCDNSKIKYQNPLLIGILKRLIIKCKKNFFNKPFK